MHLSDLQLKQEKTKVQQNNTSFFDCLKISSPKSTIVTNKNQQFFKELPKGQEAISNETGELFSSFSFLQKQVEF